YNDHHRKDITIVVINILEDEDLITEENIILPVTHRGYIKLLSPSTYRTHHRGGRGIQRMDPLDAAFEERLLSTSTHDTSLLSTNKVKVYRIKGYEILEFGRTAKGLPIINILQIDQDEEVNTVISVRDENEDSSFLFFTTKQ